MICCYEELDVNNSLLVCSVEICLGGSEVWNSSSMRIFLDDSGLEANIPNPRQDRLLKGTVSQCQGHLGSGILELLLLKAGADTLVTGHSSFLY